eukprot:1927940-Ditylum_brightwellii.AAC.1
MAAVNCSNTSICSGIASYITAEYDLTQEIMEVKEEGFNVNTLWFKVHQDDKMAIKLLPLDVQLNVK